MVVSKEMVDLVKKLNNACDAYYNTDKELMPDAEYDKLYDKLVEMEKEEGITLPNSPTKRVGFEVKSDLPKVVHTIPLKSLDKINNDVAKLCRWLADEEGCMLLKKDGLTVKLEYVEGVFKRGSTRGNGKEGEDITHSVKCFKNIPLNLPEPLTITVVGEGLMTFGMFNAINSQLPKEDAYKHPRNLVAGTIRSLDSEVTAKRGIKFYAFDCIDNDFGCTTQKGKLNKLEELGFDTAYGVVVTKDTIGSAIVDLTDYATKEGFPIDGLVCTYNDLKVRGSKGETSKFPKHSIAFKFKDDEEETVLEEVEWSIGKTADLTPVAIFKEVELDGTSVTRASMHNISIVEGLKIGIGDTIKVKKANQIIPQITENITKSNTLEIPKKCPYCGFETNIVVTTNRVRNKETGEMYTETVKVLKCTNDVLECKGQLVAMLSHYVSKKAMNVVGLSSKNIELMVSVGLLKDKKDIHDFVVNEEKQEQLVSMKGYTKKGVEKLVNSIKTASKDVKLDKFLVSLAIDGVGESLSEDLSKKFKTIDTLMKANLSDLVEMEGVSDITATKILDYFESNANVIEELISYITFEDVNVKEVTKEDLDDSLKGMTFVVTGKVYRFVNREALKAHIKDRGGKVSGSVSGKTNYLICNEDEGSNKITTAKKLGVEIITEDEFLSRF